ncbi:MAG TPA: hypothetical protein VGB48_10290 [Allosphingosinicella sp.]|jgi:hypothetical protein
MPELLIYALIALIMAAALWAGLRIYGTQSSRRRRRAERGERIDLFSSWRD